jgi:hypothetical protein
MLAKLLTTLTLVTAQTMTWAGGPLFLCVDSAGEVCIDGGPDACECCPAAQSTTGACCEEHATCKAGVAASCATNAQSVTGEPCDCQHELIAQQSTKATSNSSNMSIGKLLHTTAWAACLLSDAPLLMVDLAAGPAELAPDAASPQLGRIGSIVLRC